MSAGRGTPAAPAVVAGGGLAAWVVPALRAAAALVVGLAITFTAAHSAAFGLIAFGLYAVVAGAVLLAGSVGGRSERRSRSPLLAQGIVTVLAGVAALAVPTGGAYFFVWVVSAWAIITGALELVGGIRARGRLASARDAMILGVLTLALGIAFLVVPPDYRQSLGGIEKVTGTLTASVVLVGIFGAWAIVTGVLLGIGAVSARGPRNSNQEETA
ncbi:HdeD family acid-resistance protein [Lysinimonas soli]|uniref:HdeD family acid-resistance protein n=1 Tax=Lysinimonas soli TaxID=1074233 RepID=A0ABW0NQE1_9MICO